MKRTSSPHTPHRLPSPGYAHARARVLPTFSALPAIMAAALLTVAGMGTGHTAPLSDSEVKTRSEALEVAGAFSNDGFKIRDGHWCAAIKKEAPALIQVNLYAGNQYWFIAAATPEAKKIGLTLYDENGKALATEPYENERQAAAGFSPDISGPYYIKIEELEGDPATFCLIYSYK